jgi:hypothetical protein
VVDGRHAVLWVGDAERELVLPVDRLPAEVLPGLWLQIEVDGEQVTAIAMDPVETARVRRRIAGKLALLRRRRGQFTREGDGAEPGD